MFKTIGAKEIELFIQLSLSVTFLRILFTLATKGFNGSAGLVVGHIAALAILGGQIYFLARRLKWAWILSVIQVLVLISTGRGSFGYILTYLSEPFKIFGTPQASNNLQTAILIAAECAKTFFIYRVVANRPPVSEY